MASILARREAEEEELADSASVIAIDPGGTTGWAVVSFPAECLVDPSLRILDNLTWSHGQVASDENYQAEHLLDLIEAWPEASVVIEDFILRTFRASRELLAPVRITAAVEFGLYLSGRLLPPTIGRQTPALAKRALGDDRLKSLANGRFYNATAGLPHARDALRHALLFARRAKESAEFRNQAWPTIDFESE